MSEPEQPAPRVNPMTGRLGPNVESHTAEPLQSRICLPINRCNLPASILASLTFQRHPVPLELDGIRPHYQDLFSQLSALPDSGQRCQHFADYMAVHFRLPGHPLTPWPEAEPIPRPQANYRRLLLGWLFDSDSDSGAAWRLWVESRFGLCTRYHREPILHQEAGPYYRFMQACVRATYNTNDLASQFDLLYSFCQLELHYRYPDALHLELYRGGDERPLSGTDEDPVVLYNNLSSFTREVDEAYRFGPRVHAVQVPLSKIVCFESLLPGALDGENEFMVLGGYYRVTRVR